MFTLLLATIIIEWGVFAAILRTDLPALFLYSVLINCFTLPLATWFYLNLVPDLVVVEAGVVLVETVLIVALVEVPVAKAFLLSLLANGVTVMTGALILSL